MLRSTFRNLLFFPASKSKSGYRKRLCLTFPLSLGLCGESSLVASPKLGKGPTLGKEHADGCSSWDRWAHGPRVKVPRVIHFLRQLWIWSACRGIRQLPCAFLPHPNLFQLLRDPDPTVLLLLAGVGEESGSSLTAQLRRWRSHEGQKFGPGQKVLLPLSSPQSSVCSSRKTFLWERLW